MEKDEIINFASVERVLNAALESDEKYQRENDAKFRAVHQKVASYEEFRDIVLASHLKPLDKKDVAGAPRKQPWNSVFSATKQKDTVCSEVTECKASKFQPQTASEFQRDWRRLSWNSKEKYNFIISLGGVKLLQIFNTEISSGLLGEFLLIMAECFQVADEAEILEILEGLSQTYRFSLNMSFLNQAERDGCLWLFRRLVDAMDKHRMKKETEAIYECAPEQTTEREGLGRYPPAAEKLKGLMQSYGMSV